MSESREYAPHDVIGDIKVVTNSLRAGQYMAGVPFLYETRVIKEGKGTIRMAAHSTYDDAVEGHAKYVAQLKDQQKYTR